METPASSEHDVVQARRHIVAAFAAVIMGLVGLGALGGRFLWGLADASSVVAERIAPAIQQLAGMRGEVLHERMWVREGASADPERRRYLVIQVRESLAHLDKLLADHNALEIDTPEEQADLRRVRDVTNLTVTTALKAMDQGDLVGADAAIIRTRPENERVDRTLQNAIVAHSEQARSVTADLHGALRHFVQQGLLLILLGAIGALGLLRSALRSLRLLFESMAARHSATEERATELDAFAARIAHDLRGPLTAMRITLGKASRGAEPGLQKALGRIDDNIDSLNLMIADILDFARSAAKPDLSVGSDAIAILNAAVADIRPQAEAKSIALTAELPPSAVVAMADGPLRMIASNIIENAVKYMGSGPTRRVDVIARTTAGELLLEVRDTGVGIAPDVLPRIFEPFFRGATDVGGYGLGLATVKRLVEAHRGSVRLESTVGVGTSVAVTLPLQSDSPQGAS